VYVTLLVLAALWGAVTGALVPRPAHRLSAEPREAPEARDEPDAPDAPDPEAARAESAEPTEAPAGPPYPSAVLVSLLTALVCAALAAATGPRPELAAWLLLTPFAVLLVVVDRAARRLPDLVTLPLAAAAAALLGGAALLPGAGGSWPDALSGGLVLAGCYAVLFLVNPRGLGFGDVKLALSLGVVLGWYGWVVLFIGGFTGFALAGVYGVGLMLRRRSRKAVMPMGPFMMGGALIGVVLGALAAR
jgi:leader peptidase (prepilin peptidase)/N-methyltransferase